MSVINALLSAAFVVAIGCLPLTGQAGQATVQTETANPQPIGKQRTPDSATETGLVNRFARNQPSEGRSLFMTGQPSDGSSISVLSQGQSLPGELFACANCHRHSGLGTSEGGYQVPDITGPTLFAPIEVKQRELYAERTEGFYTRPAYTRDTLRMAITQGISSTGKTLSKVMPRYQLNDAQTDALINYLNTLDYSAPPGVSADNLQLATIITDDVSAEEKQALLSTLNQFVKEKNAQTRHEVRRVKYSPWHKDWQYDNYRHWELNLWELRGDPSTWFAQLQQYYDTNPVFAVVGGTGHQRWEPVSAFCEAQALPCLFPNTDLPPDTPGHYSIYFSAGMNLEARRVIYLLKKHSRYNKVIQVTGEDVRSTVAAETLARKVTSLSAPTVSETLSLSEYLNNPSLTSENSASTLYILWLTGPELKKLSAHSGLADATVILSSTLLNRQLDQIPGWLSEQSWLLHPYSLPGSTSQRIRSKTWLYARGIATPYERLQSNTYLALSVLTESMMHIRSNFSQDYLIERIEHMLENSPETSVYQRLSLAPGQRFASKGCYLIPLKKLDGSAEETRQYWAAPER
ncbi:c-type cytochrome [Amphritea pacifica]|uniref:Cytochrome c n=1 Tax=Amphritea pacifica TaxID=2811233 RepID=A0ABS2W756_9GAMM|nr:cytochrome c [Amphritea pacifica]MBN0987530.1 cytochrome c [Amphritea pacifica]